MLPIFMLMVGAPGCGKSMLAEQLKDEFGFIVVSSDAIREELYGDAAIQADNARVFSIAHEQARTALDYGYSVVFDATSAWAWSRQKALDAISGIPCLKVCVRFDTPLSECLANNHKRDRVVPPDIVQKIYNSAKRNEPSTDEGFDVVVAPEYVRKTIQTHYGKDGKDIPNAETV